MKTENELKEILSGFNWKNSDNIVTALLDLSDKEVIKLIQLHNASGASGYSANSVRNKLYTELFKRNNMGKATGNYLSFKQQAFLESLDLLPTRQKTIYDNNDLDRVDRLILNYLKQGYTQAEISDFLVGLNIKPNSLSTIEKKLKAIREKYKAKTNFHLAVILYGK